MAACALRAVVDALLARIASVRAANKRCARADRRINEPSVVRGLVFGLWAVVLVAALAGCGNTLYAIQANAASSKLEEARELGAEKYAPYEYYYAQRAPREGADAKRPRRTTATRSTSPRSPEEYADKAIRLAREAHRGAGR